MLVQIKQYLEANSPANMRDLSAHFRIAPEALRGMLDHWIAKGAVQRHHFAPDCGGCLPTSCNGCGVAARFETYVWVP